MSMSLNWFDFSIIGVIALSILISFFRGFLRETISLISWVSGLIVAIRFAPTASNYLNGIIATETLRYVITFVLLFVAVFIVGLLVNMVIKRSVDASGLGFADRLLGSTFGAARGILLVAIVLMFIMMTASKDTDVIAQSELSPFFMPLVSWLDGFLPEQLQQVTRWLAIDDNRVISRLQNSWQHQNHSPISSAKTVGSITKSMRRSS